MQRLRGHFIAGLIVVVPVALTIYIAAAMVRFIDEKMSPLLPDVYNPETYLGRNLPGFGLLAFLVLTTLIGVAAKGFVGRRIMHFGERQVARLPVIRSIYAALKQLAQTVFEKSENEFSQVCLIEFPYKGMWAVAFVAGPAKGELPRQVGDDDLISVFMPTTPNPTTGFLLYVPRRNVTILDMSLEEGAKLIISAGLVAPPDKAGPALAELPAGGRTAA